MTVTFTIVVVFVVWPCPPSSASGGFSGASFSASRPRIGRARWSALVLVLRGASFGAGTPVRARPPQGAGSEVRGLRSGIAVALSHLSGRRLRRSDGASNLGGGRIWHARVRHCCGVRFACRTDSPSCVCSSVWCLTRRYRPRDARCASGSSTRSTRLRAASFPACRPDSEFSSACRLRVPGAVRRSRARQTEDRVVGCATGACQHRSRP